MKLVRRKIRERHPGNHYRTARLVELPLLLRLKLMEEAGEVVGARNPDEIASELADVLEVVYTIAAHQGLSMFELEEKRQAKRSLLGGFDGTVMTEYVEGS